MRRKADLTNQLLTTLYCYCGVLLNWHEYSQLSLVTNDLTLAALSNRLFCVSQSRILRK